MSHLHPSEIYTKSADVHSQPRVAQFPFLVTLSTKNNLLGMTGKSYDKVGTINVYQSSRADLISSHFLSSSTSYTALLDEAASSAA